MADDSDELRPLTLQFKDHRVEAAYLRHHNERARVHDKQAAATYLAMVAVGTALFLGLGASKTPPLDSCAQLIVWSWVGPGAHLLLLAALPEPLYASHRGPITLALRAFYLAITVTGYVECGVGRISAGRHITGATREQPETVLSALTWRNGLIGCLWIAGAFPLLFWQHVLVQSGWVATYCSRLSPNVCASAAGIPGLPAVLSRVAAAAHTLLACLLAAVGAQGAAARALDAAAAAAASPALYAGGTAGCLRALRFVLLAMGHALPSLLLYSYEARCRRNWWARKQQKLVRQRLRDAAQRPCDAGASASASASTSASASCPLSRHSSSGTDSGGDGAETTSSSSHAGPCDSSATAATAAAAAQLRQQPQRRSWRQPPEQGPTPLQQPAQPQPAQPQPAQQGRASLACSGSGSSIADSEQQQLSDVAVPPQDDFDAEQRAAGLPPTAREALVVAALLALGWLGLGWLEEWGG